MKYRAAFLIPVLLLLSFSLRAAAENAPASTVTVGIIASLSGFAANYGRAVVEGAELAQAELAKQGVTLKLLVEDDQSDMKQVVTAYHKLKTNKQLTAVIGGTWWLKSAVAPAARDGVPLLSCETVFDDETVPSANLFILSGYLRPWVSVFRPVVEARGLRTGAVIRSTSSFGTTLGNAMEDLFSEENRRYAGTIEYSDLNAEDAKSLVLRLKELKPDAVYIDGHAGGLANVLRRMAEQNLTHIAVFTNAIARDMLTQKLFDPSSFTQLYFNDREPPEAQFAAAFAAHFGRPPILSADLGYYAAKIAAQLAGKRDPLVELKSGSVKVNGKIFSFDENNVRTDLRQEIWQIKKGIAVRLQLTH